MLREEYPVRVVCEVMNCSRSSYYYRPQVQDETELKQAIAEVVAEWPRYGYRRVTKQLQRQGWPVNHKRIHRLMAEMKLLIKRKRHKKQTTNSRHSYGRYPNLLDNLEIIRPDQVWVADITHIRLPQGAAYLAVIMDSFTRNIRGWHLGRGLDLSLTLTALKHALKKGCPEIHHSDQGLQYAAADYVALLQKYDTQISMAKVGAAWQNGSAERLIRTIKEEEVDLSDYQDYHHAYAQLHHFLNHRYPNERIHSALDYLTPAEFEQLWYQNHAF
jgi:transposase InsO family protein